MAVDSPSTTISQEFPLKVSGGYFIIARRICESDVASAPPHVREIWLYLIANANFTDNNGIKRGQCLTSYKQIQDALSWKVGYRKVRYSKSQCENAMKWYAKHHMTTAMKTTRGMIVTILKYEDYQDPKNYESHNESHNDATMMPQSCRTIHKKEKNENECKKKSIRVRKETHSLSPISEDALKIAGVWIKFIKSYRPKSNLKTEDQARHVQTLFDKGYTIDQLRDVFCFVRDYEQGGFKWSTQVLSIAKLLERPKKTSPYREYKCWMDVFLDLSKETPKPIQQSSERPINWREQQIKDGTYDPYKDLDPKTGCTRCTP